MFNRDKLNYLFLAITIGMLAIAIIVGLFLICCSNCCKTKKRTKKNKFSNNLSNFKNGEALIDFDYIDEKSVDLISSTVQVKSLHNSPIIMPRIA